MLILHVITDLDIGGAELMLKRLIESQQDNPDCMHMVISLTSLGAIGQQLKNIGVEVQVMGMRTLLDMPRIFYQLVRSIRMSRPDIVQTWMYHSDLLGGLAARIAGNRNVIWGLRGTAIPQTGLSITKIVVLLCSLFSRYIPKVIVCCAESVREAHVNLGYNKKKMLVIFNGYDLTHFKINRTLKKQVRRELGLQDEDIVVGIIGRFDPLKDYKNFVAAASTLSSKIKTVKYLMIGRGIDSENHILNEWICESEYSQRFILAGEHSDISSYLASMDIFCLSSCKEGFPNVVCEAMACGVPCVVTDVGDAAYIVGKTGIVVPARDAEALSDGIYQLLIMDRIKRESLGLEARARITENFSIEKILPTFKSLYSDILLL